MTDLHLRILRMIATQRQLELADADADADADDHAGGDASAGRTQDLEQAAGQANANLEAAEARRSAPRQGPGRRTRVLARSIRAARSSATGRSPDR